MSSDAFSPSLLFDIGYVISPLIGFIPQIYTGNLTYEPLLSILTVVTNILKMFSSRENEIDQRMTYQFIICIGLHLYLLNKRNLTQKRFPVLSFLDDTVLLKNISKIVSLFILILISSLKLIDFLGFSFIFMKLSIGIDILISLLHLKYYGSSETKPKELFLMWILGDLGRLGVMTMKYKCPIECFVSVLIQIAINLYVLLR